MFAGSGTRVRVPTDGGHTVLSRALSQFRFGYKAEGPRMQYWSQCRFSSDTNSKICDAEMLLTLVRLSMYLTPGQVGRPHTALLCQFAPAPWDQLPRSWHTGTETCPLQYDVTSLSVTQNDKEHHACFITELVEVEDLLNMCSVFSMQVIFFFCHLFYVNFSRVQHKHLNYRLGSLLRCIGLSTGCK